ncbi:MAG: hypothetical protein KAT68_06150 [Bacteroidales bacterium]|nr:hypothetical protein [Bacteroidales bacterium]
MNKDKNLIFRYDNAPHHPEIATFPHHKHIIENTQKTIIESKETNLSKVLEEIQKIL